MNNLEEQNDEICVLQSIYTAEELQVSKEDEVRGQFHAFVSLPSNFKITYEMLELAGELVDDIPSNVIYLSYLPPIILSFTLPQNYPSECMPYYEISCPWLPFSKMSKLCKKLDSLWTENTGMVILYVWTQFLKEESLSYLNIEDTIDITGMYINELKRLGKLPDIKAKTSLNSSKDPVTCHNKSWKTTEVVREEPSKKQSRYSHGSNLNMYLHEYLRAYSEDRAKLEFHRSLFMCDICYSEKSGSKCVQFKPCNHVYCKDCMKSYFEIRIKEGIIHSMPCPYENCKSEALQSQIREAVGLILFAKYDKQLLTATLDKMQDITYCPRTVCGCPVMRETDEKMAVCPSCNHVFCVFCKMTYHGVEPCRLKNEEKLKLLEEYENGDANERLKLEKRYGKRQILLLMDDAKSESWISSNSKPCPNCNVAIEKSDGCNKMVCWKCSSFFCWLCLSILDTATPYLHYLDTNSKCHKQLFEGVLNPDDDFEYVVDEEEDEDYEYIIGPDNPPIDYLHFHYEEPENLGEEFVL